MAGVAGSLLLPYSCPTGASEIATGPFGSPVGLQLHTVADELRADFQNALHRVRGIGYQEVEFAGFYNRTPTELRTALREAGLRCRSVHLSARVFSDAKELAEIERWIESCVALGAEYLVCPGTLFPKGVQETGDIAGALRMLAGALTLDDWKNIAVVLNTVGEKARAAGLRFLYHNHNFEFRDLGSGMSGWDVLTRYTDPRLVNFEVDVGWAAAAGLDPAQLLQTVVGRVPLLHVKDVRTMGQPREPFSIDSVEIGVGAIPWPEVFRSAQVAGVNAYYVEQEPPFAGSPMESARISYDYLAHIRI